jgi:hypothetical protein
MPKLKTPAAGAQLSIPNDGLTATTIDLHYFDCDLLIRLLALMSSFAIHFSPKYKPTPKMNAYKSVPATYVTAADSLPIEITSFRSFVIDVLHTSSHISY